MNHILVGRFGVVTALEVSSRTWNQSALMRGEIATTPAPLSAFILRALIIGIALHPISISCSMILLIALLRLSAIAIHVSIFSFTVLDWAITRVWIAP